MTCHGETTSERFTRLETSAPHTKPSWTPMVSQAAALSDKSHSTRSWGITAEAESQVVIDKTSVKASSASAYHRPVDFTLLSRFFGSTYHLGVFRPLYLLDEIGRASCRERV